MRRPTWLWHARWAPRQGGRAWVGLLLRLAVSGLLLSWVFTRQADLNSAWRQLAGAKVGYVAGGFGLFALGEFLTILKWRLLLASQGVRCRLLFLTRAMLVGEFYSMFLPTSVGGDVVRIALTRTAAGSASVAASAALMQRNSGMGGLLVLALVAASLEPIQLGVFHGPWALLDDLRFWFGGVAVAYASVNAVLMSETVYRWIWSRRARRDRWPRLVDRVLSFSDRFHRSTQQLRSVFPAALGISVATQLLDCGMGWLAAKAIGAEISLSQACIFVPAATLTSLLPVSLNGIGVRELSYVALCQRIGLKAEQGIALSTIHFASLLGLAFLGGLWHIVAPVHQEESKRQ